MSKPILVVEVHPDVCEIKCTIVEVYPGIWEVKCTICGYIGGFSPGIKSDIKPFGYELLMTVIDHSQGKCESESVHQALDEL